jgi:hypothetical protein
LFGEEGDPEVEKFKPAWDCRNGVCTWQVMDGRRRVRGWNGSAGGIGRMTGNCPQGMDEAKLRSKQKEKKKSREGRNSGDD